MNEEKEINILDFLLIVLQYKRMIFRTCLVALLLACVVTLMMPNVYVSTARILPPKENNNTFSGMMTGAEDLAAMAGLGTLGGGLGQTYVGMLASRTIADAIIDRFDLMKVYNTEYRIEAYTELAERRDFELGDDGILRVSVEDADPQRASDMANAFVTELKKLNVELNLVTSGKERVFLEKRLMLVKQDLVKEEETLKKFQEKNRAIRVDEQAVAIIEAIAKLRAQLAAKEVEIGVLRSYQTEQSPEVKALRHTIAEIREQLRKLDQSAPNEIGQEIDPVNIFTPTSAVPELGVQYARLLRNFKVQEMLFELLTKQYELAKISEAKNTSTIQVLDDAMPADKKSRPKRSLWVLAITLAVGFLTVMVAFILEAVKRLSPEDKALWSEIKARCKLNIRTEK